MKLKKADLLQALQAARPALSTKGLVPLLGFFRLTDDQVMACNDSQAITIRCDLDGLDCLLPGEIILRYLTSARGDDVEFEQQDSKLKVKCGSSRIELEYQPSADYPFKVPTDGKDVFFPINTDMIKGIEILLEFIGMNVQSAAMAGVTVFNDFMFATDGATITRYELQKACDLKEPLVLPGEFCRHLVSLMKEQDNGDLSAAFYKGSFVVNFGDYCTALTKLPQCDIPEFDRKLRSFTNPDNAWDDGDDIPTGLDASIDLVCIPLASSDNRVIEVEVEKDSLRLRAKGTNGSALEKVSFTTKSRERLATVDPDLFKRALKRADRIIFDNDLLVTSTKRLVHALAYHHTK